MVKGSVQLLSKLLTVVTISQVMGRSDRSIFLSGIMQRIDYYPIAHTPVFKVPDSRLCIIIGETKFVLEETHTRQLALQFVLQTLRADRFQNQRSRLTTF